MALRQAEAGTPVAEICRKLEIAETTFYRWKKKYGGLGVSELRELKQLREENRKLKQLVADLSLEKSILQEALRKKWYRPLEVRTVAQVGERGVPSKRTPGVPGLWSKPLERALPEPAAEPGRTPSPAR